MLLGVSDLRWKIIYFLLYDQTTKLLQISGLMGVYLVNDLVVQVAQVYLNQWTINWQIIWSVQLKMGIITSWLWQKWIFKDVANGVASAVDNGLMIIWSVVQLNIWSDKWSMSDVNDWNTEL